MRPWAWVRRSLALVVSVVFLFSVFAGSAFAAGGRSFSSPRPSGGSSFGGRSFSAPKPSSPSGSSKSFSAPAPTTSSPSKGFTSPNSPSYSSGSRSLSSPSGGLSSDRPTARPSSTPAPTYDVGRTTYSNRRPVVIYGPSTYAPYYWHDWYWGTPWYWRVWHRPVYYGPNDWGINWVAVIGFGILAWILIAVIAGRTTRRRH